MPCQPLQVGQRGLVLVHSFKFVSLGKCKVDLTVLPFVLSITQSTR